MASADVADDSQVILTWPVAPVSEISYLWVRNLGSWIKMQGHRRLV